MHNARAVVGIALLLIGAALCDAGCGDSSGPNDVPSQCGDSGDGDGDGDGDADPGDGDGDGDGHDVPCGSDEQIPHQCGCAPFDAPCFALDTCATIEDRKLVCTFSDDAGIDSVGEDAGSEPWCEDIVTCDEICGKDRCVENGCGGSTWLVSGNADCSNPGEYGHAESARCDAPIRFDPASFDTGYKAVTCCCKP